jgi:hypothetical protein
VEAPLLTFAEAVGRAAAAVKGLRRQTIVIAYVVVPGASAGADAGAEAGGSGVRSGSGAGGSRSGAGGSGAASGSAAGGSGSGTGASRSAPGSDTMASRSAPWPSGSSGDRGETEADGALAALLSTAVGMSTVTAGFHHATAVAAAAEAMPGAESFAYLWGKTLWGRD